MGAAAVRAQERRRKVQAAYARKGWARQPGGLQAHPSGLQLGLASSLSRIPPSPPAVASDQPTSRDRRALVTCCVVKGKMTGIHSPPEPVKQQGDTVSECGSTV